MLVHSLITNRSQYVNVSGVCSQHVSISTEAPQGCVLSPFWYTMYTNSCRTAYSNHHYFKYADDTALVGLLSDDETDYRSDIDHFVSLCVANCLNQGTCKTSDQTIDDKLRWDDNIMNLYKKGQQRLYFQKKTQCLANRETHFICVPRFICKKCYNVRSCLLVRKRVSQNHRKTKQNIHHFLQNRFVLYTRYQSGASVQTKNPVQITLSPLEGGTECQQ